jgi:hypothetical protein
MLHHVPTPTSLTQTSLHGVVDTQVRLSMSVPTIVAGCAQKVIVLESMPFFHHHAALGR